MSKATMTIEGYLSQDAPLAAARNGDSYLNLSVPHTPRRKNRDTGQWEDAGDTLWVRVALWRDDAEAFAPHARKGTKVTATGEPTLRTFEGKTGPGVSLELVRATVAIIPTAQVTRQGASNATSARTGPQAYTDEPWAANGAQAGAQGWTADSDSTPF